MSNSKIDLIAAELTGSFVKQLQEQISKQVTADVSRKLAQIDIQQEVCNHVDRQLANSIKSVTFPDSSIPASAINLSNLIITGNNLVGGIVKKFGSTGIQDNASSCQVTILDEATVIENKFITSSAEIKGTLIVDGNVTVNGDLNLLGEIPTDSPFFKDVVSHSAGILKLAMDGNFFLQYADKVFDRIKEDGLDLSKLKLNGQEILQGNRLGFFITETNIQQLGELKFLTVSGGAQISNTLFTQNKRVGINTEDPAGALAVWDEECEIVTQKLRKNVGIIGTLRNQRLILSANSKENLVLETDGSVSIEKLTIGKVLISSTFNEPKHDAKRGTVLFNENVDLGKPIGWVSLGGARWVPFGIVQS